MQASILHLPTVVAHAASCSLYHVPKKPRNNAAGKLQNLTGVPDPYEEPTQPEVLLETDRETPDESCRKLLKGLRTLGYV